MNKTVTSVCLITGGLTQRTVRLQPWRYLHELARQLIATGIEVTILSDSAAQLGMHTLQGVQIQYLPSVHDPRWRPNEELAAALADLAPDAILLHVGLTSFLHQRLDGWGDTPVYGIFTSPLYTLADYHRAGYVKVFQGCQLSGMHVLGTLVPRALVRCSMVRANLRCLVTQTETVRGQLQQDGLWPGTIRVIPPGVDAEWAQPASPAGPQMRKELGFGENDVVVLYYGSPAALRGLHTLVRSFERARAQNATLKLMILSRRHADELLQEDRALKDLLARSPARPDIRIVSGYLDAEALVAHVAAADIVALPFEIVPSDAPLTLLEAQALGKPVVTTMLGCLPELVQQDRHYLARPGAPRSLAEALCQAVADLHKGSHASAHRDVTTRSWQAVGQEWKALLCQ